MGQPELIDLRLGDCLEVLKGLPAGVARCCVTSPPYFGLRDYGVDGQIGLKPTVDAYVARMVDVFREVRRVLSDDANLWLNLGDSYGSGEIGRHDGGGAGRTMGKILTRKQRRPTSHKQLLGIPWRVAFALQADGWYLRSDIIWHKPNPMPESVRDRPTKSHEYLFLLSKRATYYYDADAVREPAVSFARQGSNRDQSPKNLEYEAKGLRRAARDCYERSCRNRRTVWKIATRAYKEAHFAVMPPALVEPCIRAGSAEGDTVLDPFVGSGTVPAVAASLGRDAIGIDLNPAYLELARRRIDAALAEVAA